MAKRKTIDVEWVRNRANTFLASTQHDKAKAGVCGLLEGILLETGNYNGFRYLNGYASIELNKGEYDRHYN